jgi:hypothetical protein
MHLVGCFIRSLSRCTVTWTQSKFIYLLAEYISDLVSNQASSITGLVADAASQIKADEGKEVVST